MSYLFPPRGGPRRLTAAQFAALPEDPAQRVELVKGLVVVSPRPARTHTVVVNELYLQIRPQLDPLVLRVVTENEVRLDGSFDTVRVPDVALLSAAGFARPGMVPSADVALAIEVLSPGNRRADLVDKMIEYADARIPHYWIVDPRPPVTATVHRLVNGQYEESQRAEGRLTVDVPCRLTIDLDALLP